MWSLAMLLTLNIRDSEHTPNLPGHLDFLQPSLVLLESGDVCVCGENKNVILLFSYFGFFFIFNDL